MPDLFMPDVVVEIAFNAGYNTPDASRTWTDVSDYVELEDSIGIGVGRQDERSTADANSLTLALDNTDGRFTADRAASPYYPNVKIGRPIRVTATPPGGTASERFVGFVDEWPVEWEGTEEYAKATIRASSRLARLGLGAKLRSSIEAEILSARPVRYWTLGDPSGATVAEESSGSGGAPLQATGPGAEVAFGNATGPSTDGLTAAEFFGTAIASSAQTLNADISDAGVARGLRSTVLTSQAWPSDFVTLTADVSVALRVSALGEAIADLGGTTLVGPVVNDGATHDMVLVWDATTAWLVVDGAIVDTDSSATRPTTPATRVVVGANFEGTLSHVAVWDTDGSLTTSHAQAQAAGVASGFAGDTTDERLSRILGWAGVASTEITTDPGSESMTYQQTTGQSVVDALRECESTEGGVLFDGRDGRVTFHSRSRRYLATTAATLDMASQHVGSDFSPKLDRTALTNDVEVSNPTTEEKARKVDTASRDEYGTATSSATSVATTYDALQQKAAWLVASYAEPRTRVPSLTVDVLAHQGLTPSAQTLLGLTVGDLLAVTNAPTQADTTDQAYFVEGYTETIGPQSYSITFNLSPTYPTLSTFVLNSATRGLLNTGLLAL